MPTSNHGHHDRVNRLLLIAPQPCFEIRGTPMNVFQMCAALTESGREVHLATYPFGDHEALPGLVYHRAPRVPFVRSVPIGFSPAKVVLDLALVWTVVRLLLTQRFAAIHAVEEAAFFAVPLARLFRTPVIVDLDSDICDQLAHHDSIAVRAAARLVRPLQRASLRWSDCAVTVCRSLTELVERCSPGKPAFQIEDVPLPSAHRSVDAAQVAALRETLGLGSARVILYTGNLEPYQGVDLLIEAMPSVVERFPDAVVVVVGGQRGQIEAYQRRAEALGVGRSVHLVGQRPPDTMAEFMAMADVLVSPRREGENTPLKIYTYMLSGRPIVATDLATHTQVLDDRTAVLVPATADGVAEGLMRVLVEGDGAAELGRRAKDKVEREHSYDEFKRKMNDVYAFIGC